LEYFKNYVWYSAGELTPETLSISQSEEAFSNAIDKTSEGCDNST